MACVLLERMNYVYHLPGLSPRGSGVEFVNNLGPPIKDSEPGKPIARLINTDIYARISELIRK